MKPANTTSGTASPKTFLLLLITLVALHAPLSASVKVTGFGLFGNAELQNALRLLEFEDGQLDARKIDDGAFLLLTRLTQNGYLDAQISATFETESGEERTASWTSPFEPQLPDDVVSKKLQYKIAEGQLYYYDQVDIAGLVSIDKEEALQYFVPDTALYSRKKDRSYSASILSNQQKQLAAALAALGRTDAKVTTSSVETDTSTGAVDVSILVDEGPLYQITEAEVYYSGNGDPSEPQPLPLRGTYSRTLVEDQVRILRNDSYRLGYPDTKVTSRITQSTKEAETVSVKIRFDVQRGPKITLTAIEHVGATDTHLPVLNRKSDLPLDVPLDITEVEAARRRLSALGIYERIDLRFENDGTNARKAIFDYVNGQRIEVQLLLGYGSYESFRAGIIAKRENVFGRAHTLSFNAIRSVKSTSGKISYSVPEIFGESINGNFEANYLDRQELVFDRTERGISLGLSKRLPQLKTDVAVAYAFDKKISSDTPSVTRIGNENTDIGSVSFRATRSTLNNILYPSGGYEINSGIRYAAKTLGGQAEFIHPEISGAYHRKLGQRWIFHVAGKGSLLSGPSNDSGEIPYAERFLVGGENSLRGYRRGEAGPIDENGNPVSVEAFTLLNLELEYPLFDKLNVVLFSDTARIWKSSDDFSAYEDLSSLGLGFRYNTIVGPVRLEYGHNLNPRPEDPNGTLHLSVGFPF